MNKYKSAKQPSLLKKGKPFLLHIAVQNKIRSELHLLLKSKAQWSKYLGLILVLNTLIGTQQGRLKTSVA